MGVSIWQLLIVLAIVLVLFGTKKLRNVGADLGGAIKNFKNAMQEGGAEAQKEDTSRLSKSEGTVIEGEATRDKDKV